MSGRLDVCAVQGRFRRRHAYSLLCAHDSSVSGPVDTKLLRDDSSAGFDGTGTGMDRIAPRPEGIPGSSPVPNLGDKFAPPVPSRPREGVQPEKARQSSIQLAEDVVKILTKSRDDENLSAGECIIRALETTVADDSIVAFLHPHGSVGGKLFARREVLGPRATNPLDAAKNHAVGVKLFPSDFAAIDELIESLHARSRPHLINAAIRAYDNTRKVEEN